MVGRAYNQERIDIHDEEFSKELLDLLEKYDTNINVSVSHGRVYCVKFSEFYHNESLVTCHNSSTFRRSVLRESLEKGAV